MKLVVKVLDKIFLLITEKLINLLKLAYKSYNDNLYRVRQLLLSTVQI